MTNNIGDYIENNIGAVVKYFFLNISIPSPPKGKEITGEFLEQTVYNEKRTVLFPPKQIRRKGFNNMFSRHIEADAMINHDQLRICDNTSGLKIFSPMKNDSHPDQRGQNELANCIIDSFIESPPVPTISRII